MRVTITTSGSRGDVEPFLALGLGLASAGNEVTVAAPEPFGELVRSRGLRFHPVGSDPRETTRRMLEEGEGLRNFARNAARALRPILADMLLGYREACEDADAIVYTPIGFFGHALAESFDVPRFGAGVQPIFARTDAFPSGFVPPLPGGLGWYPSFPLARLYNYASYVATEQVLWQAIRKPVNDSLREIPGMRPYPMSGPFGRIRREREPGALGWSNNILPKPPDWGSEFEVTGYWFLPSDGNWRPPPELLDFLESGPTPISVGFGSMNNAGETDFAHITDIVLEAIKRTRQRAVLLTGWGNLGAGDLPDEIFAVEEAPHDWLFPRVSSAVHHGGAGTTAASLRAGIPTATVPFFTDQPFWGSRISHLGVGPEPIPRKRLSAQRLAAAIDRATSDPIMRSQARLLGERIRSETGVERAVEAFHRHVDREVAKT